jgi:hypothetical protein
MKQQQIPVFFCHRLAPEVPFLQSHQLPYLSLHYFRHCVFSCVFFIAAVLQNLMQLFTHKM